MAQVATFDAASTEVLEAPDSEVRRAAEPAVVRLPLDQARRATVHLVPEQGAASEVADSSDRLDRAQAEVDSVLRHDSVQGQVLVQMLARGARLSRADPRLLDRLLLRVTMIDATVLRTVDGVERGAPRGSVQLGSVQLGSVQR